MRDNAVGAFTVHVLHTGRESCMGVVLLPKQLSSRSSEL